MSVLRKDTAKRREEILEAAIVLTVRFGVKGVSVARISQHIGMVPSAIYRHFSGIQQILDGVVDYLQVRLMTWVGEVPSQSGDALDRLSSLFFQHMERISRDDPVHLLVFCKPILDDSPDRRARFHGIAQAYMGYVAGLIGSGQAEGRVREDRDPKILATLFLGQILAAACLWRLSDGRFDIAGYAKASWPVFGDQIMRT